MSKGNEYITYTRGQLEAFSVEELRKLDLYKRAGIKSSVRNKNDIIGLLLEKQNAEEEAAKSVEEEVEETQSNKTDEVENSDDSEKSDDSETEEEEEKSEKPVFHRTKRKRNRMTFR